MLRTDEERTCMVNGSRNDSSMNKTENVISRLDNMHIGKTQMEWPTYQENGQRKYGPPTWWTGPPPPKGTEVFLSHLHRQVMEDELCPVLSTVGTIYTFRLMMDFSGSNRGFGFVQYATREQALRARKELNDYPIRPGSKMTVEESMDNCRLFIGRIPKNYNESQLEALFSKYMSGLKHVFVYMSPLNKKENRGFCFIEFEDHRSAAMGRRYLLCSGVPEWRNFDVNVDWAIPERNVPEHEKDKVTAIFLRNLPITTPEERIRQLLESITINIKFIIQIRKVKDFAFIHFTNRAVAQYAFRNMDGAVLDGAVISASWATPEYKYKGEYIFAGPFTEAYIESLYRTLHCSRPGSFSSARGNTSDGGSMFRGAPLFKRKDKMNKPQMKIDPVKGVQNGSVGSCSPSRSVSPWSSSDDSYVTCRSVTHVSHDRSYDNLPTDKPFVNSTPTYRALVKSVIPSSQDTSFFQDRSKADDSIDSNLDFNLHQYSGYGGTPSHIYTPGHLIPTDDHCVNVTTAGFIEGFIVYPGVGNEIPDNETHEYKCMKDTVSKLLLKHSDCAYEVLKIIAHDFDWGTIFYHPLELNGGWIVSLRVLKGTSTKTLVNLDHLCETEEDALNMAASKFLREYLLDSKMFPITKVLFFP